MFIHKILLYLPTFFSLAVLLNLPLQYMCILFVFMIRTYDTIEYTYIF